MTILFLIPELLIEDCQNKHFPSQFITPNGFQSEDRGDCLCKFCGLLVDWTLFFSNRFHGFLSDHQLIRIAF